VPVDRIDYVEAQDDYVGVRTGGRVLLKEQTLGDLASQLDPRRFVRIHRSYIVNVAAIARIEPASKDNHCAVLKDGTRLPISRSGYQKVRELMREDAASTSHHAGSSARTSGRPKRSSISQTTP
jgi:two-component system LytT family response regulator